MPTFSFSIKEKLKKININSITHYRLEKILRKCLLIIESKSLGSIENNLKKIEILKYRQDNELYYLNSSLKNINKIINETKLWNCTKYLLERFYSKRHIVIIRKTECFD